MMRIFILFSLIVTISIPTNALEIEAPEVPSAAAENMPSETSDFTTGLWELLETGLKKLRPNFQEALKMSLSVVSAVVITSVFAIMLPDSPKPANLTASIMISTILLSNSSAMIRLASDTISEISSYGKMLCAAMTSAVAAQGGLTTATALYAATTLFDAVLTGVITHVLVPLVYLNLLLSCVNCAIGEDMLKNMAKAVKSMSTWLLKILLTVFTTYISITGVVSGTTDAAALKATKLTISTAVPVIGGILSDTSEAVLVSAGILKNAAGIYGILAILAMCLGPFLRIGTQYIVLKATVAVCGVLSNKTITDMLDDFAGAMGQLLGMTGTVCIMFLISTVCFMRGLGL